MKHAPVLYDGGNVLEKHNEENVLFWELLPSHLNETNKTHVFVTKSWCIHYVYF